MLKELKEKERGWWGVWFCFILQNFFADFAMASVYQVPLSVICTITLLCFSSCAPINCSTYMPSHFFLYLPHQSVSFHSPTPPSHLATLSVAFHAHCGDESFEQHPKALPPVDLHLNSPPPSPSSSSSSCLLCGMFLAHTAHYPAGSPNSFSHHQENNSL